jgi:hypothetical protein
MSTSLAPAETPATPDRPSGRELDAECLYDLGYARGVRETLATLRLTAATSDLGRHGRAR